MSNKLIHALIIVAVFLFGALTALQTTEELKYQQTLYNRGYNEALDTVQKIMDRQLKDTTIVSKVSFETKKDTLTYILSNK